MQLIQIQEPNTISNRGGVDIAVGIDFGTTNSLVAVVKSGNPIVLSDEHNKTKIPSVVAITKNKEVIVGTKAVGLSNQDDVVIIKSIKRLLGKKLQDLDESVYLKRFIKDGSNNDLILSTNDISMSVVEVASKILEKIKSIVDVSLGVHVKDAVITVPAYFDETQRRAVKLAAELAHINVLRMINEPTAAALAYRLDKIKSGTYMVYDLGGGTFDVSVLKIDHGVFRVLATGGDMNLGGDDLDYLIAKNLLTRLANKENYNIHEYDTYEYNIYELLDPARQIKEQLSYLENVHIKLGDAVISMDRNTLDGLIEPLIVRTMKIVEDTLERAQIDRDNISGIILVGGSTRTILVKNKLLEVFPKTDFYNSIDPDEVVAIGAAMQAENLASGSGDLLLDVTPLSFGLELMGGINEKIIPRNSTIPISVSKEFTTYEDGQTGLKLHIVQGERDLAKDCRSLAKLELVGIPPMRAGAARINVIFTIDTDGLLTVTAKEKLTNISQVIEVMPTYGLDSEAIEKALLSSVENLSKDHDAKLLAESIIYAKEVSSKIMSAIHEDKDLLSDEEYNSIYSHIENVSVMMKTGQRGGIDQAVNILEESVENFIARRMNKYISISPRREKIKI